LGYTYDKAREHFGCAAGVEVEHLEDLATRMCLERTFFDRVHLCSRCGHHAINFRQIAPASKSPDIARMKMIRHLKCEHVAPRRAFIDGPKLLCPGCGTALAEPGVDHEETSDFYVDNGTGDVFAEPGLECVCLACGHVADPARLVRRNIFSYAISERGLLAAETGYLYDISLDSVLMDYDLQVYNPSYFQRQLSIEMERARRYRHPLSLGILCLDQYEGFLAQYGEPSRRYLAQVAQTLKNNTRASDIIARYEHHSVIVLFPETDLKGAGRAAEKLRNEVLKLQTPRPDVQLTVSCGISTYPEAADNQQMLVKTATTCYQRARQLGGNVVVTADPTAIRRP
jgi:diguanylate cyclase (GGDEF)-like protein